MVSRMWERRQLLGSGSFGRVYAAEATSSDQANAAPSRTFAVKSVPMASAAVLANAPSTSDIARKHDLEALENEIAVLAQLRHDNVISFLGSSTTEESGASFRNLHMEYAAGGNVSSAIRAHGGCLPSPLLRLYLRDVLRGLEYIHSRGVVHGDIKGLNLLITSSGVKLADFGSARQTLGLSTGASSTAPGRNCPAKPLQQKRIGTANWMSPEAAAGELSLDAAADVWSLGCTVLEMVTGKPAWSEVEGGPYAVLYALACTETMPVVSADLPSDVRSFISCCLQRNPAARSTATQLRNHPLVATDVETTMVSPRKPMALDCLLLRTKSGHLAAPTSIASPSSNLPSSSLYNLGPLTPSVPSLMPASPTSHLDKSLFPSCASPAESPRTPPTYTHSPLFANTPRRLSRGRDGSRLSPLGQAGSSSSSVGAAAVVGGKRERSEEEGGEKRRRVECGGIPLLEMLGGKEEAVCGKTKWPEASAIMPRGVQWIICTASHK